MGVREVRVMVVTCEGVAVVIVVAIVVVVMVTSEAVSSATLTSHWRAEVKERRRNYRS